MVTYSEFVIRLNDELINLSRKGIGQLPLTNLEIEFPDIEKDKLVEMLIRDGLKAVSYKFSDGVEIFVDVR